MDELALLGAPAHIIDAATKEPDNFNVHKENHRAVVWFCDIADLMRFEGSTCLGLDLPQVAADAQLSGRQISPETYKQLRTLGQAAAEALNNKHHQE